MPELLFMQLDNLDNLDIYYKYLSTYIRLQFDLPIVITIILSFERIKFQLLYCIVQYLKEQMLTKKPYPKAQTIFVN